MSSIIKENNCNRKYKTVKAFSAQIELYFKSLQEPVTAYNKKERRVELLYDQAGNLLYHNKRPPTMSGLCVYLGFRSRTTLENYERIGAEWLDAVTRARLRIEQSWTELLACKDSQKGAEFYLRCTCKWIPEDTRRELEIREREAKIPETGEGINLILNVADCSGKAKKEAEEIKNKT